jgi:ribosomal protein S18 acetylase RimI-like enzyme
MENNIDIVEFNKNHTEAVKDLLVELQEYIASIDKFKLNILTDEYRDRYFELTMEEVYSNQGKIFVATNNDCVVGMVAGYKVSYTVDDQIDYKCPPKGMISELIVSKNQRGGGVGKQLMSQMEKYLIDIGCEYIKLQVFAYNQTAYDFYKNLGYEPVLIDMLKKV